MENNRYVTFFSKIETNFEYCRHKHQRHQQQHHFGSHCNFLDLHFALFPKEMMQMYCRLNSIELGLLIELDSEP